MKEAGGAEAKILRVLDKPTTMEFIETPLRNVADQLKLQHEHRNSTRHESAGRNQRHSRYADHQIDQRDFISNRHCGP